MTVEGTGMTVEGTGMTVEGAGMTVRASGMMDLCISLLKGLCYNCGRKLRPGFGGRRRIVLRGKRLDTQSARH